MRRIHSREVAQTAGVSLSTLSKVLNGREIDRIPEGTRQRVLKVVRDLNYVPRSQMRELRTGRTGRIGVLLISPVIFLKMDPYHQGIFDGIVAGAHRHQRNLVLYTAFPDSPEALRRDLLGGSADGVLVVGNAWGPTVPEDLHRSHLPAVYVSSAPIGLDGYYLTDCDNVGGGRLGVEYLLSLGHRHIALIGIPDVSFSYQRERIQGALTAMGEAQKTDSDLRCTVIPSRDAADITRIIVSDPTITSVFVPLGELLAGEIMECLAAQGKRVPEDISIVGFDSTSVCDRLPVPLTAIAQPLNAIGEAATELLISLIDDDAAPPRERRLPVHLDIRASSGPPALKT